MNVDKKKKMLLSKFITNGMTNELRKLDSPLQKKYVNTFFCSSTITEYPDGSYSSKYCKNRWCLTCNRILTGRLINLYHNSIKALDDKWFITLTIPNVYGFALPEAYKLMSMTFRQCLDIIRKRKFIFRGFRKLEVTYNKDQDDYHPHYHVLVNNKEIAFLLLNLWLEKLSFCSPAAQDIRQADEKSIKELFKYFTKLTYNNKFMPVEALNEIFVSLYGYRVFFAYKLLRNKDVVKPDERLGGQSYWYYYDRRDWFNIDDKSFSGMSKTEIVTAVRDFCSRSAINF